MSHFVRSSYLAKSAGFRLRFLERNMFFKGFVLTLAVHLCLAGTPEQGKWQDKTFTKVDGVFIHHFSKVSFNSTKISLAIDCTPKKASATPKVQVKWVLRFSECAEEYDYADTNMLWDVYLDHPEWKVVDYGYEDVKFANFTSDFMECGRGMVLRPSKDLMYSRKAIPMPSEDNISSNDADNDGTKAAETDKNIKDKNLPATPSAVANNVTDSRARKRRAEDATKTTTTPKPKPKNTDKKVKATKKCVDKNVVYQTWERGNFLFVVEVIPENADEIKEVKGSVEMYYGPCDDKQYISAIDWPLLPFYGVLCAVYTLYAVGWLLMLACFWRDLLRIQFWIGGVIFLGMLEKAMYEAEYQNIDQTGHSVRGLIILAELTSCLKRAIARMLVVIVSVGFGIVKPRLGPTLHKVVGVGGLYFILAAIEGCIRVTRPKYDAAKQAMLAIIPLSILDFAIAWWIFSSLVQTTRTLRLRRNIVKLSLYRHFTNTLIFSVVASVAFMIWVVKIKFEEGSCMQDWDEKWLDDGYWHLLFAVILLVIIVLWRPSQNNQRYAFSPLLDAAEEEDEPVMNDAFEGMKMRGVKQVGNSAKDPQNKVEEDLKWIEENIPASVADTALPSLLDSDEEIMTTKFEMSKME